MMDEEERELTEEEERGFEAEEQQIRNQTDMAYLNDVRFG